MPKRVERIAYVGREALAEALSPEPSEEEIALQRLELENKQLKDELRHLQSALEIAGRILQPYFARLNGG